MARVAINPQRIDGPWIEGFVLDRHVVSSRPLGYQGEHMQFETTRSPMGKLVYQLKYRNGPVDDLVETAVAFAAEHWAGNIDCVVASPPSLHRARQPVMLIADGVAKGIGVPMLASAVEKTTATQQMKNVPIDEREPLLAEAIQPSTDSVQNRRILLVDDLWETGSTKTRCRGAQQNGGLRDQGTRDDANEITMSLSIIFVAGSRHISRLPAEVKKRLDTMIEKRFQILVGDANGADKALQQYLSDKEYPNVIVHCMERHCRNNIGHWPTREVAAPKGVRGFDFYSIKDRAMADAAEYGLMLWDGKSKGTINNVVNLSRNRKPVVVYIAPTKQFLTVKVLNDLCEVLAQGDTESVERLVSELHLPNLREVVSSREP